MDVKKIQQNRDLISTSNMFQKRVTLIFGPAHSMSTFLGRPSFLLHCEPELASHSKTIIDVSYLVDVARKIFEKDATISHKSSNYYNSLELLTLALDAFRPKDIDKKLTRLTKIGKNESLLMWEQSFLRAAEWFSNLPSFMKLEDWMKLDILKSSWLAWTRLEKRCEAADYQKSKILENGVFMCGNGSCLAIAEYEVDLSWCTNYTAEQLKYYLSPDSEGQKCIEDLIELSPSSTEVNFMILQLTLHHAGKKSQGRLLEATENIIEAQANHLHSYYVEKVKMPNYSARLAKMMKINRGIAGEMRCRREKNQIARVFDIMKVEFSDPEMFELT